MGLLPERRARTNAGSNQHPVGYSRRARRRDRTVRTEAATATVRELGDSRKYLPSACTVPLCRANTIKSDAQPLPRAAWEWTLRVGCQRRANDHKVSASAPVLCSRSFSAGARRFWNPALPRCEQAALLPPLAASCHLRFAPLAPSRSLVCAVPESLQQRRLGTDAFAALDKARKDRKVHQQALRIQKVGQVSSSMGRRPRPPVLADGGWSP